MSCHVMWDRYLSTWFLMDLASTIPFEALGFLVTGKHRLNLSYSLLGMLRFWRLRRVKQLFTRLTFFKNIYIHHENQIINSNKYYSLLPSLTFSQLINKCRLEKDIRFSYFWVRCARLLSVSNYLQLSPFRNQSVNLLFAWWSTQNLKR